MVKDSARLSLRLALGVAAVMALPQEAGAQSAPTPQAEEAEPIIVRARKREEAIEDVPASVTVLTPEMIDRLGLETVEDYVREVPGAILVGSGPEYLDDIALRGQGGGRLGFSETTTGIYRNGIFVAGGGFGGRTYTSIDLLDIRAMEIYRGPQGALYGRNAVGGAVNVITQQPTHEVAARVRLGTNSVENTSLEFMGNAPITDAFSIRVAGYMSEQEDGYIDSVATGEPLDTESEIGGRIAFAYDFGPSTRLVLTAESSQSEAPSFTPSGRNLVVDPAYDLRNGINVLGRVNINQDAAYLEFTHGLGWADLTILANYKQRNGERLDDFDHFLSLNTPAVQLTDAQAEDFERSGFEARLSSPGNGALTWLIGADYQTYTSDVRASRGGAYAGANPSILAQFRNDFSTEELTSYSIFALLGYDLTDRLNLTVEGRAQVDQKSFVFERVDTRPGAPNTTVPRTPYDREWERFLPAVSLTFEATESTSFYGRVATGYRPGGYNPTVEPGFEFLTPYDPEDIVSGEVGVKGVYRWGDWVVRPQLALFYSQTDSVQVTTALSATSSTFVLDNVPGANIFGGEFELSVARPLLGGRLLLNLGVSGADGNFDDGSVIIFQGTSVDISGFRINRTRDYILGMQAAFMRPIGWGLEGYISANYHAEDGGYDNANHSRISEPYELYDMSAGISGEGWSLNLYGRNLNNEVYRIVDVSGNNYYNTPRTLGVRLTFER